MSDTALYRIEEYQTSLWNVPFENCTGLTKDQAKVRFEELVNHESLNPNRLRVVREAYSPLITNNNSPQSSNQCMNQRLMLT